MKDFVIEAIRETLARSVGEEPAAGTPPSSCAVPSGAVGEDCLLMVVTADDRPGHAGGPVLGDSTVEQCGDGGAHGIGQGRGGRAGLRHGSHCRGWA